MLLSLHPISLYLMFLFHISLIKNNPDYLQNSKSKLLSPKNLSASKRREKSLHLLHKTPVTGEIPAGSGRNSGVLFFSNKLTQPSLLSSLSRTHPSPCFSSSRRLATTNRWWRTATHSIEAERERERGSSKRERETAENHGSFTGDD
ncbi:hypothetical protein HanRHA438_Chr02g0081561 [Helianthus annuus]|nr:hypothetical protein HanRHA438_Chr02g0081561 [Helianthus annuus]